MVTELGNQTLSQKKPQEDPTFPSGKFSYSWVGNGPTLTNPLLVKGRVKADLVLLSLYSFHFNASSIAARLLSRDY